MNAFWRFTIGGTVSFISTHFCKLSDRCFFLLLLDFIISLSHHTVFPQLLLVFVAHVNKRVLMVRMKFDFLKAPQKIKPNPGFRINFSGVCSQGPENQFFGLWVPPLETSQDQYQHERGVLQTEGRHELEGSFDRANKRILKLEASWGWRRRISKLESIGIEESDAYSRPAQARRED